MTRARKGKEEEEKKKVERDQLEKKQKRGNPRNKS